MVTRTHEGRSTRPVRRSAGAIGALLSLTVAAAPPLGYRTAPGGRAPDSAVGGPTAGPMAGPDPGAGGGTVNGGTTAPPGDGGQGTTPPEGTWVPGPGGTAIISAPTGYVECTPNAPIRVASNTCVNQETVNAIDGGWNVSFDDNGAPTWKPPASYNPTTGQWGSFNGAAQACNPTIEVKLKQAALAGSQLTRAISDKQLSYPQTDPIEAVNNPQKDGAGGVCTIDIFAFDLGRLLGSTYDQIKNMIDMLSNFSVDSLFGAACKVVNSIFGNLQNQLLNELQTHSPLSQFQQFVNQLTVGYVSPLASFTGYGSAVRPTTATLPGIVTADPLQVSYVPGKGYVYMINTGAGNMLVVNISQTPLSPADTVTPTPAPAR